MRQFLSFLGLALVLTAPVVHAQTPAWTAAVQPTNPAPTNDTGAQGNGLTVDAAGNQYVAGGLLNGLGSGAVAIRAFGSTSLSSGTGYSSGFAAKLSPSQQWLWAVRATSNGENVDFIEMAVSPAGDAYAVGTAENDPGLYPSGGPVVTVGSYTYTTTKPTATFVTRLNANGQPQWLAGVSGAYVGATGWDTTAGNLVVVGAYEGVVTFGTTTLPAPPPNTDGFFVARLSATGQWLSAVGVVSNGTASTSRLAVSSAAVGPQGQAAVAFRVRTGSVTLGSTVITSTSATVAKNVVAQLSAANQWTWATEPTVAPITGSVAYQANGLRYDRTGNLWLAGEAGGTGLQLGTTPVGGDDAFVARLSATGQWGAVGTIGHAGTTSASDTEVLGVDAQGNALLIGSLPDVVTYTFGTRTLANPTADRKFVARFNPTALSWDYAQLAPAPTSAGAGFAAEYQFNAAAFDAAGSLFATGVLSGNITFGNTTLANPSQIGSNAFVAKLANAGAVLAVRQAAGAAPLAVYPNPATAGWAVTLRLPVASATPQPVTLRDALGRVALCTTVPAGRHEVAVPTAGLAPGLYLVEAGLSRAQVVVE